MYNLKNISECTRQRLLNLKRAEMRSVVAFFCLLHSHAYNGSQCNKVYWEHKSSKCGDMFTHRSVAASLLLDCDRSLPPSDGAPIRCRGDSR